MIRARNIIIAINLIAGASILTAGTLDQPPYSIDLPDGWTHSIEASTGDGWGDLVTVRRGDEDGLLKIVSYHAPVAITEDRLRNMTNVDAQVTLTWEQWGEFAGYQYAYEEQGSYYLQWFLVNGKTLLLITYQGDPATKFAVATELAQMIGSLKVTPPAPE